MYIMYSVYNVFLQGLFIPMAFRQQWHSTKTGQVGRHLCPRHHCYTGRTFQLHQRRVCTNSCM